MDKFWIGVDDYDTYEDAVADLNRIAADYESRGWIVERGMASSDNLAAIRISRLAVGSERSRSRYIGIEREQS
jgi:hypothetical protein